MVIRYGVRCATPERAVFDAVRWAKTLEERVQVIDMASAAELTSPRRVRAYALDVRDVHDRVVVIEASGGPTNARSHRRRCGCVCSGVVCFNPREPAVNRTVLDDDGRRLGTPDLVDEELEMGAEFDGAEHRTRERHRRDVRRLDDFQRAGLEIATFVGADLDDERLVVERLRATSGPGWSATAALAPGAARPVARRATGPPRPR